MERFDDIQTHRTGVQENILKAFGVDIEKGVYVDNAENRKLGRVGRTYGKSQTDDPRKGDLVSVVGPTGMRATGKVVAVNGGDVTVHIKGNEYFSGRMTHNATAEQRKKEAAVKEEQRREEKRAELQRQLRVLDKQEERVRLDQDQDPEVLENMTDGNNPAVKRYGRMLSEIDRKRTAVKWQLKNLK